MTAFPRDLIAKAFPGQPRMQAAFEGLVADAEALLGNLEAAATALAELQGDTANVTDILASKQPKSDILTALSLVGPDPGVLEQLSPGIVGVRAVDTADTASLLTRALADTRYLGGAHGATSAAKWTTARSITITGDGAWTVTVDGSANVSAGLTLATVNSNTGTYGGATTSPQFSVDGKGRITGVAAVTITPAWTSITGTPTTLAGYGITNGQTLNANLTAISGLATVADKLAYWTGSGTAALISFPSAARTALPLLSGTNTGDQTSVTGNAGTATALQTARNIDGQSFNGTADVTVIAPGTHAATSKATPVDADEIPLVDSGASNILKKLTWANLKATLKTYFDTLYQPLAAALTSWASVTRASGFDTFAATPSSANLRSLLTDETGTGAAVFAASPNLTGTVKFGSTTVNTWNANTGIMEGGGASLFFGQSNDIWASSNGYYFTGWKYKALGKAANIGIIDGEVWLRAAPSGSADATLTYTMPIKATYSSGGWAGLGGDISTTSGSLSGATVAVGPSLANAANDAAAATASVAVGQMYRNGSVLMIRVS